MSDDIDFAAFFVHAFRLDDSLASLDGPGTTVDARVFDYFSSDTDVVGSIADSFSFAGSGSGSTDADMVDAIANSLPYAYSTSPASETGSLDDVIPIAGDGSIDDSDLLTQAEIDEAIDFVMSSLPALPPDPGPEDSGADEPGPVEDSQDPFRSGFGIEPVGGADGDGPGFLPELIRENPWLAAAVGALLLALAIGLPLALLGGSSRPAPTAASTAAPATTAPPATTAATTTAAAPAAAAPAVSATDVSIANFSLFQPPAQGFEFSLEAPSTAPAHETVTLDFGGPGLPTTRKVTLVAGQSVPMKYPTHGCGSWTVRVAAIDGKAIDSKGNPDLENGMTHPC